MGEAKKRSAAAVQEALESARGGHAVRADGLLCRVSEPHGSLSALDRGLSSAICKPERLKDRGIALRKIRAYVVQS